jgi:hypothetical protein
MGIPRLRRAIPPIHSSKANQATAVLLQLRATTHLRVLPKANTRLQVVLKGSTGHLKPSIRLRLPLKDSTDLPKASTEPLKVNTRLPVVLPKASTDLLKVNTRLRLLPKASTVPHKANTPLRVVPPKASMGLLRKVSTALPKANTPLGVLLRASTELPKVNTALRKASTANRRSLPKADITVRLRLRDILPLGTPLRLGKRHTPARVILQRRGPMASTPLRSNMHPLRARRQPSHHPATFIARSPPETTESKPRLFARR